MPVAERQGHDRARFAAVNSRKNDAADTEAAQWPRMRFVAIKSADQQTVVTFNRTRDLLSRASA